MFSLSFLFLFSVSFFPLPLLPLSHFSPPGQVPGFPSGFCHSFRVIRQSLLGGVSLWFATCDHDLPFSISPRHSSRASLVFKTGTPSFYHHLTLQLPRKFERSAPMASCPTFFMVFLHVPNRAHATVSLAFFVASCPSVIAVAVGDYS